MAVSRAEEVRDLIEIARVVGWDGMKDTAFVRMRRERLATSGGWDWCARVGCLVGGSLAKTEGVLKACGKCRKVRYCGAGASLFLLLSLRVCLEYVLTPVFNDRLIFFFFFFFWGDGV